MQGQMDSEKAKPYVRLWASVMLVAIEDAWSKSVLERDSARAWINSDRTDITSFHGICLLFDMDQNRTRNLILDNRGAVSELRRRVLAQDRMRRRQVAEA